VGAILEKAMTFTRAFLVFLSLSSALMRAQDAAGALAGIWESSVDSGPLAGGELIIDGRGATWRAAIGGFQVDVKRDKDSVRFSLPGDQGEFRGRLDADARGINGDWIQPANILRNNRYTTPVHLSAAGANVWRGDAAPLNDRYSFYVSVTRAPDGSLAAFITSPETNFFRRRKYKVELSGAAVTFTAKGQKLEGDFDSKNDTLTLRLVDFMPPFRFKRDKENSAIGFYPRIVRDPKGYVYRPPIAGNDGWRTASLREAGIDEKPIAALIEKILNADPGDNSVYMHSLLIARHGKLALEEYFYGFNAERPHDTRSAGKTYAPMLAGIAHDHGAKLDANTPVYSLFPQYKSFANWDDRKKKMTVRDVMTMTAGNSCDDNEDSSPGNEDRMQNQDEQPDWYKYTLDLPMLRDPGGEHAIYCSGDLNLVGGIVASVTGKWLPEFFDQYVARPLQFHAYHLNLTPTKEMYTGGGAYIRPRDELKLGQVYLDGGMWNGRRIVSKDWVDQSTAHQSSFAPQLPGEGEHQYGYGWHIHHLKSGDREYRDFAAGGNGGQFVIVIPDLDLVIGINGGSYGEFTKWYRWELELVPQYIIPAAAGARSR